MRQLFIISMLLCFAFLSSTTITHAETGIERVQKIIEQANKLSEKQKSALEQLPYITLGESKDSGNRLIIKNVRVTPEGKIKITGDARGYYKNDLELSIDEAKKLMDFLKELFDK